MNTMNPVLQNYIDEYSSRGITLDSFQIHACRAMSQGHDVLVCAPTGSGKTVVAHYAVELSLAQGYRCIYTAPIKALTNQKYAELVERHGEEHVGLLTGDNTINREAHILVVTTEVLRNMLFSGAQEIDDIGYVVLDEVHYLADKERGPVWEEIILTLPSTARLVGLSATVANTQELLRWLRSVRGPSELVLSEHRPVPLMQHVSVGHRVYPLYGKEPGEPLGALVSALSRLEEKGRARIGDRERRRIISQLQERDMLPAIEFIFSRKGCEKAVQGLVRRDITLTNPQERKIIKKRVEEVRKTLSESDIRAINFEASASCLVRGYGAHHAGVYPALKTLIEKLMEEGLLKLVYATGTLALGIDMPVRSVVVESLRRWDGEEFVDLSATEYTQLIGRAGRRGRDDVGHALILGSSDLDPYFLASLGSGKVEPLLSAFTPSYNTVINLIADRPYSQARAIMGRSFAQYQRNADLQHIEQRLEKIRARIRQEEENLVCSHGNLVEYLRARASAGRQAKSARKAAKREYRSRIKKSFAAARNSRVYAYQINGELEYCLLLSAGANKHRIIDWYGDIRWLREEDLGSDMREVGSVSLPTGLSLKSKETREALADAIVAEVNERTELGIDRDLLGSWSRFAHTQVDDEHPCASCPDVREHIRQGQSLISLDARSVELTDMASGYEDSVGREFDATASILSTFGLLQGQKGSYHIGPGAPLLRALHTENDLLLYLCLSALSEGELSAVEFAGWSSMFLGDDRLRSFLPRSSTLARLARKAQVEQRYLIELEQSNAVERTGELTPGCADVFEAWASGAPMEQCLADSRLAAGDFITAARRLIDLLGQIATAGEGTWIEDVASQARSLVRRNEVLL